MKLLPPSGFSLSWPADNMVSMPPRSASSYHSEDGIERAIIDLVRVGARGHGSGVRQLAIRLMRTVPPGIADPEEFRNDIHAALAGASAGTEVRFAEGTAPTDVDGAHRLADVDPAPQGSGLVLAAQSMEPLAEVVAEWENRERLEKAGVTLTRTLLLSGAPGVGKTMAARWLAGMLGLPLVSLDLASAVSSYLGTSGRNIKSVLDYAKSAPCVLLLDEFDAIAKRRDDDTDIGELRRVVNVILVELDRWPHTSLLIAATNHPQLLDPAVGRRFDRAIELPLPGTAERALLLRHLGTAVPDVDEAIIDVAAEATEGWTCSDLTRLWELCRRRAILQSSTTADVLLTELAHDPQRTALNDAFLLALKNRLKYSNRRIAGLVGLSHPTVAAALKRAQAHS